MRVWHSAWSWLKLIVAAESVAGNTRTGMFTRLILRKPFQVGLAAMGELSAGWRSRATRFTELHGGPPSSASAPSELRRDYGGQFQIRSELEADLELKHPGWIDIRQRRERVGRGAGGDDLAERRVHGRDVPVGRLGAAQDVPVVQQVEAFHAKQERAAARLDPPFEEQADVLRAGAAEGRLGQHRAVDHRTVVVGPVAV